MYHHIPYIDIPILYPMYIIRNHVLCVYDPHGSKYVRKFTGYEDDFRGERYLLRKYLDPQDKYTCVYIYIRTYSIMKHHKTYTYT